MWDLSDLMEYLSVCEVTFVVITEVNAGFNQLFAGNNFAFFRKFKVDIGYGIWYLYST
jgi:hypothetical protein